ncbi:Ribosome-binding ATPase YchF [Geodia barretti]|uniref:Ribosome-binding ATPase YchF n=1 Tax=Geodia barretti TaxID=519541 RepID=A0AA35RFG9_GEOBA|nr:Ribosome-binding ATPase YchF [Geodia barretti]
MTSAAAPTQTSRTGGKGDTRVVEVPDARLQTLADLYNPRKVTPAVMSFVDPVLTGQTGAHFAESLLTLMRDADALAHVVGVFGDDVDPLGDFNDLNNEVLLADLAVVEKRLERVTKDFGKMKRADLQREQQLLRRCQEALEAECPLRRLPFSEDEQKVLRGFGLLSSKAQLVVLNLDEARRPAAEALAGNFSEKLADDDVQESGLDRFIRASYALLGLCSFFTAGEKDVRAWTIPHGAVAQQAAGVIHSDLARGFIRAEVIHFDDLVASGSMAKGREAGKLRIEGKTYPVQDGDVLTIRFNV